MSNPTTTAAPVQAFTPEITEAEEATFRAWLLQLEPDLLDDEPGDADRDWWAFESNRTDEDRYFAELARAEAYAEYIERMAAERAEEMRLEAGWVGCGTFGHDASEAF